MHIPSLKIDCLPKWLFEFSGFFMGFFFFIFFLFCFVFVTVIMFCFVLFFFQLLYMPLSITCILQGIQLYYGNKFLCRTGYQTFNTLYLALVWLQVLGHWKIVVWSMNKKWIKTLIYQKKVIISDIVYINNKSWY